MTPTRSGLGPIAYAFPAATRSVRELEAAGLLESDAGALMQLGFGSVHVAFEETPFDLACEAAARVIERAAVPTESIGLLIYSGAPTAAAFATAPSDDQAAAALRAGDRFKFPATRLQHALELDAASVIGVEQLACTGLFAAVRLARSLCASEGVERALCVSSEFFPADLGREAVYNCTSDAACAVLVERAPVRNRIASIVHITKGYYWDADALRNELIASYFPTARHAIDRAIREAGWTPSDVDWVIPHNVSARSWEILMGLVRLPRARLWMRNIARDGHTLAGDNFINLADAMEAGDVRSGHRVLLFSFGYGAHWSAMTLEV